MATEKSLIMKTEIEAQFDEYAKRLLAHKPFLARILVFTVEEFQGMSPKQVEKMIEGEPIIGQTPVDEGFTNEKAEDGIVTIRGMNNESKVMDEGLLFYDVIFYVRTGIERKKVIVNLEAQKDMPTMYHVENRGILYGSRMISSQLEREISGQKYDELKKVYSIWICMNCLHNQAYLLEFQQKNLIGNKQLDFDYRLINIVVVELAKQLDENIENKLHRLLGAIFLPIDMDEKTVILENEFELDVNGKEMISTVCNLSQGIKEIGIEEGRIMSIAKAIKNGSVDIARQILEATEEEITEAKKLLESE